MGEISIELFMKGVEVSELAGLKQKLAAFQAADPRIEKVGLRYVE